MLEDHPHYWPGSWRIAGSTVWTLTGCVCSSQSGCRSICSCLVPLVAVPCVCCRFFDLSHPAQSLAAVSALYFFCTRNCVWSLVTEAKEKCKFLRDEAGTELGVLVSTWWNVWTHWKPHEDSAMVWGFPQQGARGDLSHREDPEWAGKGTNTSPGRSWHGGLWLCAVHDATCHTQVWAWHTSLNNWHLPHVRLLYHLVIPLPYEWQ